MKTFSETQRYAKAVYRLAYEAKSLDVLEKDFLKLKEIVDQSSDLKNLPSIEKLVGCPSLKQWDKKILHSVRVRLAQELVDEIRNKVVRG